ncbi:hypothetical protein ABCS02_09890 [Microbacterium sp. X-17]|uniref:hypothetical protein n=1 Tax=Microbacterium sp. X-17 TaxID=3144404 RepID=UPI0031F4BF76
MNTDIVSVPWRGYRELRAAGWSRTQIDGAVATGTLVRVRRGRYLPPDAPPVVVEAVRHGGRLDCISLLAHLGVFVFDSQTLHVQFDRGASRLPPRSSSVAHWRRSSAGEADTATGLREALAQACRCQSPRHAVATLDSAWHRGFVDEVDVADVFARLPAPFGVVRKHLDPRAEAGTESLVRLMLRGLGGDVRVQVDIATVGRVDLVVGDWLIVECDSREFHGGPAEQQRDRQRDLAAAALGYTTLRLLAEDILYRPERVLAALRGILSSRSTAA